RYARAGTLRLLAVTSHERLSSLRSVPTLADSGLEGFEYLAWQAVFAPAGTPAPSIGTLVSAWHSARKAPQLRGQLEALDMAAPDRILAGEPLAAFLRAECARLGRLIREQGIKAE